MRFFTYLLLLILGTSSLSWALDIQSQVAPNTLSTGDMATLQITITNEAPVYLDTSALLLDDVKSSFDFIPIKKSDDEASAQQWQWEVWPKKAGQFSIPPLPIHDAQDPQGQAIGFTEELTVQVSDLLASDPSPQLRDIKGPESIAPPWQTQLLWASLAAGALLLIALAYWGYRRWKQQAPETLIPKELPHERAFRRLKELELFRSTHPTEVQEYYYQLSAIFRDYLEDRFQFAASSMTTQELIPALSKYTPYPLEDHQKIVQLCQQSDLIKYAENLPTLNEIQQSHHFIHALVEQNAFVTES